MEGYRGKGGQPTPRAWRLSWVVRAGRSGSISSTYRDERWQDGSGNLALSQTGNWTQRRLDLSGDGDFSDTDELDDAGTFNKANEWLTRDLDNNSGTTGNNFTLAYDAAGNMLDDGRNYEYVWDGFGRLRQVKKTTDQTLVAEYRYNGLGYRLSWKYDTDGDLDVDGSDQAYFFVYDLKWRPVATYRGTDANPKERFIFHNAGLAGSGSSSYIDTVILRDKDADELWTAESDATLEERRYYCQNWRADVVALLKADGAVSEWIRYSAYGEATVYPFVNGDYNGDHGVDGDDIIAFNDDWDNNVAAADVDRANGVDGDDITAFYASWDNGWRSTAWTVAAGLPGDAGQLSVTSGNRIGYAGYQFDPATEQYHVRHRVYSPEMGRWTRRDPLGYVDGMGLMEYVGGRVVTTVDGTGLCTECTVASQSDPFDTLKPDEQKFCLLHPLTCSTIDSIRRDLIDHFKNRWPWQWWIGPGTSSVNNAVVHCTLACMLRNVVIDADLAKEWLTLHETSEPRPWTCSTRMDLDNNDAGWNQKIIPAQRTIGITTVDGGIAVFPDPADRVRVMNQCVNRCEMLARNGRLVWINGRPPAAEGTPPHDGLPDTGSNCIPGSRSSIAGCCYLV